nr:MAG TPA: hypothetical protein [Caudoviricetes sp.]
MSMSSFLKKEKDQISFFFAFSSFCLIFNTEFLYTEIVK